MLIKVLGIDLMDRNLSDSYPLNEVRFSRHQEMKTGNIRLNTVYNRSRLKLLGLLRRLINAECFVITYLFCVNSCPFVC